MIFYDPHEISQSQKEPNTRLNSNNMCMVREAFIQIRKMCIYPSYTQTLAQHATPVYGSTSYHNRFHNIGFDDPLLSSLILEHEVLLKHISAVKTALLLGA